MRRHGSIAACAAVLSCLLISPLQAHAAAANASLRLGSSAQVTFEVAKTESWPYFAFNSSGGGAFVAAYFPSERGGWVHVAAPGGTHETLTLPFGSTPKWLTLQPHHSYVVDFITQRAVTITFPIWRALKVTSVHARPFRAGLQTSAGSVANGTAAIASATNQLPGVSRSTVALAVAYGSSGNGRVFSGSACSAAAPVFPCAPDTSGIFGWADTPDVDVVGTTYATAHPDPYLDGAFVLADGSPITAATLYAFGLYLQ